MKTFTGIIILFFGLIQFNDGCKVAIGPFLKIINEDVKVLVEVGNDFVSVISAAEADQSDLYKEIKNYPNVIFNTAKALDALLHFNNDVGKYMLKSCTSKGTQSGTIINVPNAVLIPYVQASQKNSVLLKHMIDSLLKIKTIILTDFIPEFPAHKPIHSGNYSFKAKSITELIRNIQGIAKSINGLGANIMAAEKQSAAAPTKAGAILPSIIFKTIDPILIKLTDAFHAQSKALYKVVKSLPISAKNESTDKVDVVIYMKIMNKLFNGISGLTGKIIGIGKSLQTSIKQLENPTAVLAALGISDGTKTVTKPPVSPAPPAPPAPPVAVSNNYGTSNVASIPASLIPNVTPYIGLTL